MKTTTKQDVARLDKKLTKGLLAIKQTQEQTNVILTPKVRQILNKPTPVETKPTDAPKTQNKFTTVQVGAPSDKKATKALETASAKLLVSILPRNFKIRFGKLEKDIIFIKKGTVAPKKKTTGIVRLVKDNSERLNHYLDEKSEKLAKSLESMLVMPKRLKIGLDLVGKGLRGVSDLATMDVKHLAGNLLAKVTQMLPERKPTGVRKFLKSAKEFNLKDFTKSKYDKWKLNVKERIKDTRIGKGLVKARDTYRAIHSFGKQPVKTVAVAIGRRVASRILTKVVSKSPDKKELVEFKKDLMESNNKVSDSIKGLEKTVAGLVVEVSKISTMANQKPSISTPSGITSGTKVPTNISKRTR